MLSLVAFGAGVTDPIGVSGCGMEYFFVKIVSAAGNSFKALRIELEDHHFDLSKLPPPCAHIALPGSSGLLSQEERSTPDEGQPAASCTDVLTRAHVEC